MTIIPVIVGLIQSLSGLVYDVVSGIRKTDEQFMADLEIILNEALASGVELRKTLADNDAAADARLNAPHA